jgi:hypothetical protein
MSHISLTLKCRTKPQRFGIWKLYLPTAVHWKDAIKERFGGKEMKIVAIA